MSDKLFTAMKVLILVAIGTVAVPLSSALAFSDSYEFLKAVREQDYRQIKILLQRGVNINTRDQDDGTTPLYIAVSNKDAPLVGYLASWISGWPDISSARYPAGQISAGWISGWLDIGQAGYPASWISAQRSTDV